MKKISDHMFQVEILVWKNMLYCIIYNFFFVYNFKTHDQINFIPM